MTPIPTLAGVRSSMMPHGSAGGKHLWGCLQEKMLTNIKVVLTTTNE